MALLLLHRQRDGHDLPLADRRSAARRARGRHPRRGDRPAGVRDAGRSSSRARRSSTSAPRRSTDRAMVERLFPPGSKRREAFERRGSLVVGDVHPDVARGRRRADAGARRRRSADDRDAAEEHAHGCAARAGRAGRSGRAGWPGRSASGSDRDLRRGMLKVALTGGIATGKSHVLERFRGRGVAVPRRRRARARRDGGRHRGDRGDRRAVRRRRARCRRRRRSQKLGPIVFADARRGAISRRSCTRPSIARSPPACGLRAASAIATRRRRRPAAVRNRRARRTSIA